MKKGHTFHIPVMGTSFSIDTPIKVAKYGISSVISLVDDALIEDMRKHYCKLMQEEYTPITKYDKDFRARRTTAYLNLVDKIVKSTFQEVKNSCFEIGSEITKYFENLSNASPLKKTYTEMLNTADPQKKKEMQGHLREEMYPGEIQVNIMTKLDRTNYAPDRTELPGEYSDALAALRGYAKSTLTSAIVFSAGINRKLYSYVEKFEDFYANANGFIKKKIVLKVSDYRSAIIQGRFFAKKGLWVSEYRIESGLNCGGHAFASDGFLMGPILEEFKNKKQELIDTIHKIYNTALEAKNRCLGFHHAHAVDITAQGGIGTCTENNFLIDYYRLDGTGWASPFLLVPEATTVDKPTLNNLAKAGEDDLYLSDVSPLGVPFNNLKSSFSDLEKERRAETGKAGSPCPKGHLVSNTEFTEKPICTASRQYQKIKIEQLDKMELSPQAHKAHYKRITAKSCICSDLGGAALIKNNLAKNGTKQFSAVCPGPNLAYFSKIASLQEMIGHIYGRVNLLNSTYRPNMFIKELKMYVNYFVKEVEKSFDSLTEKKIAYLNEFRNNLNDGIAYYKTLFPKMIKETEEYRSQTLRELQTFASKLEDFASQHANIFVKIQNKLIAA